MNTNGNTELTIFQGGPSLHINTSGHQLEEEEELQDQQRRNAEVFSIINKFNAEEICE